MDLNWNKQSSHAIDFDPFILDTISRLLFGSNPHHFRRITIHTGLMKIKMIEHNLESFRRMSFLLYWISKLWISLLVMYVYMPRFIHIVLLGIFGIDFVVVCRLSSIDKV